MKRPVCKRWAFYFLRITQPANALAQSQVWVVNAQSRAAAERRLDAVLRLHATGQLTREAMEIRACYPCAPATATLKQIRAAAKLSPMRDYYMTARGPAIHRPKLVTPDAASSADPTAPTTQGSPAPSHSNGATDGDFHADSQGTTQAGR